MTTSGFALFPAVLMICAPWTRRFQPHSRLVSLMHFRAMKRSSFTNVGPCYTSACPPLGALSADPPSTQRHEASSNDVNVTSLTRSPTLEECTLRPPHLRCIVPHGCISNCWNSACMMHVWLCRLYGAHSHSQGGWFITTATNDLGCPTQSQWLSGERLILPLTHTHTHTVVWLACWLVGWLKRCLPERCWMEPLTALVRLGISHTYTCRHGPTPCWDHMRIHFHWIWLNKPAGFSKQPLDFFSPFGWEKNSFINYTSQSAPALFLLLHLLRSGLTIYTAVYSHQRFTHFVTASWVGK